MSKAAPVLTFSQFSLLHAMPGLASNSFEFVPFSRTNENDEAGVAGQECADMLSFGQNQQGQIRTGTLLIGWEQKYGFNERKRTFLSEKRGSGPKPVFDDG